MSHSWKCHESLFVAVDNEILVNGISLPSEAQSACWSFGLARVHTQVQDEVKCLKHNEPHMDTKWTDMHDLFSWPGQAETSMPVLYFQKWCMIGTIKQTKKMYLVPARIIIWCSMPIVVSFVLITIIGFFFSNVCEYINMYYWWCVVVLAWVFYTQDVSNFWVFFKFWLFLLGVEGYWDCSLIVFLLPIKSKSSKIASF